MARYKQSDDSQWQFTAINFSKLFPADHPLAQLLTTIRRLDLNEFDAAYANDNGAGGRPAVPCDRILAVIIYSLLYGGLSMRNLQRELSVRADLLYLSGGMTIDHTTFSVFRKRHHAAILKLFGQTVFLGAQSGLIDLDTVCIDGTKIKAWANRRDIGNSKELLRRYEYVRDLCEKRYIQWEGCQEDDERRTLAKRVNRLNRTKEKIEKGLEFLRRHPERKRAHLNEPDADWQKDGSKGFVVGYNAQLGVDSKSQMIVHTEVVVDAADTGQAVPMVKAIEAKKREVCAAKSDEVKYVMDCGYFSGENLRALHGRDLYIPDQQYARVAGGKTRPEERPVRIGPPPVTEHMSRFGAAKLEFAYNREEDSFECPQGGRLIFRRVKPFEGVAYRDYQKYGCGSCPIRARCIGGSSKLTRKDLWVKETDLPELAVKTIREHNVAREGPSGIDLAFAMRKKLSSRQGKETYRKRFQVSEGVFAVVKELRAGNRFLRIGLERVREEWTERCIAHNLAKLSGFTLCSLMNS